jgi:hypothetical protein
MRTLFLGITLLLAIAPTTASAQQCTIACFADGAGTDSFILLEERFDPICPCEVSFFVVMFVEDTVASASYSISIPELGLNAFISDRVLGPSGSGLNFDEVTGTSVLLGECALGFGASPVIIEEYFLIVNDFWAGGAVTIGPNTSQHPTSPVYATCDDIIKECDAGPALIISYAVPSESSSFGSIKNLYR